MTLRCEVDENEQTDGLELTLRGAADVAAARMLCERLVATLPVDRNVTIVLDELERLDGAGVQLLIAAKRFVENGGHACTVRANDGVARSAIALAGATDILSPSV
jgi:anti-sigma B factor antagonist